MAEPRYRMVLLDFFERQMNRISAEVVISVGLIVFFTAAYFRHPDDQKDGALIAAFAAAWGYFIGRSRTSKEDRDQLGTSISTTRAAVRALSEQNTERGREKAKGDGQ